VVEKAIYCKDNRFWSILPVNVQLFSMLLQLDAAATAALEFPVLKLVTGDATLPSNNPLNPDLPLVSITIRSILFFSNILLRKRFLFHIYSNIFKKDILLQSYHGKCEYKYRVHFQGCGRT